MEKNSCRKTKKMAIKWAHRIFTPWAEHMAYRMGVLKEDNRVGRYMMNIGLYFSRRIGKFIKHPGQQKHNQRSKLSYGYKMCAIFSILYLIAGVK